MRTAVIDTSAVLAFLFDEPGAGEVEALLQQAVEADKPLLITAASWAEVLWHMHRKRGEEGTTAAKSFQRTMPLDIAPLDGALAEAAAQLQSEYNFGLARAFAVALAKSKKAELVTSDTCLKAAEKFIRISWLNQ